MATQKDKNTDTLFFLLNEMLFELNSSHCGVGLLSELDNDVSPYLFKNGDIGLDIRIIENKIVVTKVFQNSPAKISQIKAGYLKICFCIRKLCYLLRGRDLL